MEYIFITNSNNFNNNDFKSDLILLEKSEVLIWDLHKSGRIIDLFDAVKKREKNHKELVLIYKTSTKRFDKIQEEIVAKYPEIESVNFKSHFEKIIILLTNLEDLLEKQTRELNISDNLLYFEKRTQVLNGNKKFEYESEFTTTVKEIINLINSIQTTNNIENSNININDNNINTTCDEKLQEEIINKKINIEDINKIVISEPILTNNNSILEENLDSEDKFSNIPESENKQDIIEEPIVEEYTQNNANLEQITPLNIEENLQEEETLQIENKSDTNTTFSETLINQKEELQKNNEPTIDELIDIIESYFCYNDSPEIGNEEKENILKNATESKSALKYAKILLELENEGKLDELMVIVNNIYQNTLSDLYNYDIGISPYSSSKSWVIWDIAKQFYYYKYPTMADKTKYKIANPLTDENKQNEILDRRIGWEIYSKMSTGELDKFLIKFKEPIYRKRMVEFMIEKPNKYNTLSSYKLAELGKNVRNGFDYMKK